MLTDVVLAPLADAFLQVGTWVALTLAAFGLFVLLATDLRAFAAIHVLLFVGGMVSGTIVDRLGLAPARPVLRTGTPLRPLPTAVSVPLAAAGPPSTVGAASARVGVAGGRPLVFPDPALVLFWVLCGVGLVVGSPSRSS